VTASEPALALALSARDWTDRLHRFLADHGGARVRVTAIGPDDLEVEMFDVLLIDDSCSFLTPRLVEQVRRRGRGVIGVFDPVEFADGKERLREIGVADVIEATAHPDEFLEVIRGVSGRTGATNRQPLDPVQPAAESFRLGRLIAIGGPPGGTGVTEIAIGIAHRLGSSGGRVALIDADDSASSVAQRLGLPLHPNLLTAIDSVEQGRGVLELFQPAAGGAFAVMAGLAAGVETADLRSSRLMSVVEEARTAYDPLVLTLASVPEHVRNRDGRRAPLASAALAAAGRAIAVGTASPVGVTRLLDWIAVHGGASRVRFDVIVNRAPRDRYRRAELVEEITRTFRPRSLALIPFDSAVEEAAWEGTVVGRGRFRKALDGWITDHLVDTT
jgi:MinD-like ATPase involved in chromosome partitioning or flagellar assembly